MTLGTNNPCPGEGTDPRIWRWGTCWLQNRCSFHTPVEPLGILLAFPPFLAINCPVPTWLVRRFRPTATPGWYVMARAGFRYDKNWKGYIVPELALKLMQSTVYY
jgi:hypothetical protein